MSNSKKGLKIGRYRITPLGLGTLAGLIVLIAAIVVLIIVNPFASTDKQNPDASIAKATSTPEAAVGTPVPTAVPTATPAPRSATVRALGEIAIETDLLISAFNQKDSTFDFSPMFSEIADIMGDADYTIADVEGTLGDTLGVSGAGSKMYTPSAILTALKNAGVDMMMLANDHALDGTFAELQATVQNVADAGLDYVGAALSAEEKQQPVIKNINGIKVGFVAYCESMNGNENSADPNALAYGVNLIAYSNAANDVMALRNAGADVIIACVNWGQMFNRSTTTSQQQIAFALTSLGVDVIIGYNPHTVQPAIWLEAPDASGSGAINKSLCICATGNFLSNQRDDHYNSGLVFEFTIQEKSDGSFVIENPIYIPTYVLRSERDDGDDTTTVYDYRTLAVGRWTDEDAANLPEGMSYSDLQRMGSIWSEMQTIMGNAATIARE